MRTTYIDNLYTAMNSDIAIIADYFAYHNQIKPFDYGPACKHLQELYYASRDKQIDALFAENRASSPANHPNAHTNYIVSSYVKPAILLDRIAHADWFAVINMWPNVIMPRPC